MLLPLLGRVPTPLVAILALWAFLLYGGMFASEQPGRNRRMPRWMRLGSSLMLVLAAWLWWFHSEDRGLRTYTLFIAVGMSWATLGDFFLADVFPMKQSMLAGIAAFSVCHVSYIAGFLYYLLAYASLEPTLEAVVLAMVAGNVLVWWRLVYPTDRAALLRWVGLVYIILLSTMAGLTVAIGFERPQEYPGLLLVTLGGLLFWASDLILGLRIFRELHFPLLDDVIWLTYGTGQMLIVFSSANARPR